MFDVVCVGQLDKPHLRLRLRAFLPTMQSEHICEFIDVYSSSPPMARENGK
jgi:hypothetical protein